MRIGIDLGGTNIAGGVVGPNGELLLTKTLPAQPARGAAALIGDIISLCSALLNESGQNASSIGIGCPGTVNPAAGTIVHAANIGFFDVPIAEIISKNLKRPVNIENDAVCAALAEYKFGAAKGSESSVTITLGTGIGGGIIINGGIYNGAFFGAGEVGHHIIHIGGELCGCGQRGCWEAYASSSALIRDAASIAGDSWGELTAKTVFDKAREGNSAAITIVENYYDHLCVGLSNIINILQPEIIVLGGGISAQGDTLLAAAKSRTKALGGTPKTRLKIAQLGNAAGIIGASMLQKS